MKYLPLLLLLLIYVPGCVAQTKTPELEQLRADYKSLQQLKTEFDQSLKTGKLSKREAADFKIWIGQLQQQMAADCRVLKDNSAALPADPPCEKILATTTRSGTIDINDESTEVEKTQRMIEQLNGSLGEFDERLLTEQDRVKSRTPRTESAAGGTAGGAAGNGSKESEDAAFASGKKEQAGKNSGQNRQTTSNETGTPTKSTSSQKSTAPKDIPDGRNDDVIARQLREAAEKESDPELKKKLWDEYRRYKSGSLK